MELQAIDIEENSLTLIEDDFTPEIPKFASDPTVAAETVKSHLFALQNYLESANRESEYVSVQRMVEGLLEAFAGQSRVSAEPVGRNLDLISDWLGEPRLGLSLASFSSRSHPRLDFFFRQSHLGLFDYCRMLKRYLTITTDVFSVTLERNDSQLALVFHPHPDIYVSRHQIEGVVASVCDAILDSYATTPDAIQLTTAAEGDISEYSRVLGRLPEFNAATTRIVFSTAMDIRYRYVELSQDDEPVPLSEQAFRGIQALEILHRQEADSERWSDRCRFLVELLLSTGEPSKTLIAELLAVTPRTLQRRLADEGTGHRELLNQVREDKAKEYLRSEDLSLDDIAFLLGFKDTAVFYRAFKQWTRMTPGEYRALRGEYLV